MTRTSTASTRTIPSTERCDDTGMVDESFERMTELYDPCAKGNDEMVESTT